MEQTLDESKRMKKKRVCKISVIINVDDSDDDNHDNNTPLLAMVNIKATTKNYNVFFLSCVIKGFFSECFFFLPLLVIYPIIP